MTSRVGLMVLDRSMGDLEAMPWAEVRLVRRLKAEILRLVSFRGDQVGDSILTVATPERLEEYLRGVSECDGWEHTATMREFGCGPEGLVWPGHRATMATRFAAGGSPEFAAALRQSLRPGQMFLVVHCSSSTGPQSVVVPVQLVAEAAEFSS